MTCLKSPPQSGLGWVVCRAVAKYKREQDIKYTRKKGRYSRVHPLKWSKGRKCSENIYSHREGEKACARCHLSLSVNSQLVTSPSATDLTNAYSRPSVFLSDPKHLTLKNHFKTHTSTAPWSVRGIALYVALVRAIALWRTELLMCTSRDDIVYMSATFSLSLFLLIIWCKTTLNLEFILK